CSPSSWTASRPATPGAGTTAPRSGARSGRGLGAGRTAVPRGEGEPSSGTAAPRARQGPASPLTGRRAPSRTTLLTTLAPRRSVVSVLNRLLQVPEEEITPEELYVSRRTFMRAAAALAVGTAASAALGQGAGDAVDELMGLGDTDERITDYEAITTYNNFYEFGYDQSDPPRRSGASGTEPRTI